MPEVIENQQHKEEDELVGVMPQNPGIEFGDLNDAYDQTRLDVHDPIDNSVLREGVKLRLFVKDLNLRLIILPK